MTNNELSRGRSATAGHLLKLTAKEWSEDKAPQLGAALAYYTVFSLAPLILVLLAIIGIIFRNDAAGAWTTITAQMGHVLDPSALKVSSSHRTERVAHRTKQCHGDHRRRSSPG